METKAFLFGNKCEYFILIFEQDTETELDSAAEYIQSNVRGYKYHKEHISRRFVAQLFSSIL